MSDRRQTLYICNRCNYTRSESERAGRRSGADFYAEVERQFAAWPHRDRFNLVPVECMSNCTRPCVVALAAPGKYTYMFGDLDPGTGTAAAVLECALVYAAKPDGFMNRDERPDALRKSILGRIPPIKIG